jgi:hypothetical protein
MSKVTFGGYPSVPRKSPILKSTSSASHWTQKRTRQIQCVHSKRMLR